MEFTNEEKKLLKLLVKNELDEFSKEGKTIILPGLDFLEGEEEYKIFVEAILKKFD